MRDGEPFARQGQANSNLVQIRINGFRIVGQIVFAYLIFKSCLIRLLFVMIIG